MYPTAMKVIGDMNTDGRSVELTATATDIMWRNIGDAAWIELCPKEDLKGDPGANIELRKTATEVQWRKVGDSAWVTLYLLSDVKGDPGANATTMTTATQSANGLMSSTDKAKLDGISSPSTSVVSSGGRPIGTAFTVHATRNAWVTYSLGYVLTATLALGQNVQVTASVDGAEVSRLSDGILLGLAGILNRNESISFFVPAGKQVLLTKTGAAGITVTVTSGQETLL